MQQSLPKLPTLSVPSAVTLCASYTVIYVGLLYLVDVKAIHNYLRSTGTATNPPDQAVMRTPQTAYSKDDPRVIVKRIISVGCTCVSVPLITWGVIGCSHDELLLLFGVRFSRILEAIFFPLLLTMIIFAGPLVSTAADGDLPGQQGMEIMWMDVKEAFSSLQGLRSYIIGPVSEELVFRACMTPLLLASGLTNTEAILCAPLLFGVGHIHHAWDYYNNNGADREALKMAVLRSMFQFLYTTIFGWYSMFLFLRTGHIISPIVAHIFCNMMGFPDFSCIQRHPESRRALVAAYITGMVGFSILLFPLTEPSIYQSAYWP